MNLADLCKSWTPIERKQALAAMKPWRKVELRAALIAAGWTASDLRAARWTASDLRAARWTASALIAARWTASALRAARWTASDLIAARWTASDLRDFEKEAEKDIKAKTKKMGPQESGAVLDALNRGLMNGSDYGTLESCGCLLGTAAKRAGQSVSEYCLKRGITEDSNSPAEQWFMGVQVGDTPDNSYAAKMGIKWIEEATA